MLLLRSAYSAFRFAELDPSTGLWRRIGLPSWFWLRHLTPAGRYARLGERDVAIYSDEGRLWVQIDDLRVPVDQSLEAEHQGTGGAETLTLRRLNETIEIVYEGPRRLGIPDVTPNADEEDHDFGLLLHNVISDPARQAVLLEHTHAADDSVATRSMPAAGAS